MPSNRKVTAQQLRTIWRMESEGYTRQQIADATGLKPNTVSIHKRVKVGANSNKLYPSSMTDRMVDYLKNGHTCPETAEHFGVSISTVIRRVGRPRLDQIKRDRRAEMVDRVHELEDQGITSRREQGKLLHVDTDTLYRLCGPTGVVKGMYNPTISEIREVRDLYRQGETMRALAAKFGCHHGAISDVVNKRGRFEFV